MESFKMQLELRPDAITIRAKVLEGVLTTKTFKGDECYFQMLTFIKQTYPYEQFIPAEVILK